MTTSSRCLPLPAFVLAEQNAAVGAVVLSYPEPGHAEGDQGAGNAARTNRKVERCVNFLKVYTYTPTTQRQQQRAQARVLGPDLVLVLTWC